METGFDHYIAKPINARELPDLVNRILDSEKANR